MLPNLSGLSIGARIKEGERKTRAEAGREGAIRGVLDTADLRGAIVEQLVSGSSGADAVCADLLRLCATNKEMCSTDEVWRIAVDVFGIRTMEQRIAISAHFYRYTPRVPMADEAIFKSICGVIQTEDAMRREIDERWIASDRGRPLRIGGRIAHDLHFILPYFEIDGGTLWTDNALDAAPFSDAQFDADDTKRRRDHADAAREWVMKTVLKVCEAGTPQDYLDAAWTYWRNYNNRYDSDTMEPSTAEEKDSQRTAHALFRALTQIAGGRHNISKYPPGRRDLVDTALGHIGLRQDGSEELSGDRGIEDRFYEMMDAQVTAAAAAELEIYAEENYADDPRARAEIPEVLAHSAWRHEWMTVLQNVVYTIELRHRTAEASVQSDAEAMSRARTEAHDVAYMWIERLIEALDVVADPAVRIQARIDTYAAMWNRLPRTTDEMRQAIREHQMAHEYAHGGRPGHRVAWKVTKLLQTMLRRLIERDLTLRAPFLLNFVGVPDDRRPPPPDGTTGYSWPHPTRTGRLDRPLPVVKSEMDQLITGLLTQSDGEIPAAEWLNEIVMGLDEYLKQFWETDVGVPSILAAFDWDKLVGWMREPVEWRIEHRFLTRDGALIAGHDRTVGIPSEDGVELLIDVATRANPRSSSWVLRFAHLTVEEREMLKVWAQHALRQALSSHAYEGLLPRLADMERDMYEPPEPPESPEPGGLVDDDDDEAAQEAAEAAAAAILGGGTLWT